VPPGARAELDDSARFNPNSAMPKAETFFRDVVNADFWRALAPWVHVEGIGPTAAGAARPHESAPRSTPWPPAGYLRLDGILDQDHADSLARAVVALRGQGLHPTFLYVYDEAWQVLDALLPRLSPLLGEDFEPLADVWAWCIDPRKDPGGWPIHRGWYEDVRDGSGAPALVNVWVALSDATERNACMHFVPLPRDPHYAGDLQTLTGLEALGVSVPTPAGSVLVWDANVAHWGGTCDPSFDEARISMSFTLRRRARLRGGTGGPSAPTGATALRLPLAFRERLDVIALGFETYGGKELAPQSPEMRWASLVNGMRLAAARSAGPG
jgi:Phytanoyl-CoA dioxygenase (PhyH)